MVFFPQNPDTALFDIAVSFYHIQHPGCTQFGAPINVREWIKNNPRSTSLDQRTDLFQAIEKGQIEGIKPDAFFTVAQVHYWWHKGISKTAYISNDPWMNVEHILNNHPMVRVPQFLDSLLTTGEQCSLLSDTAKASNVVRPYRVSRRHDKGQRNIHRRNIQYLEDIYAPLCHCRARAWLFGANCLYVNGS